MRESVMPIAYSGAVGLTENREVIMATYVFDIAPKNALEIRVKIEKKGIIYVDF